MISRGNLLNIYFNKTGVDLGSYPFNLPFFSGYDGFKMHPRVTYFIGDNGTGKSTLLEAIAVASGFNPEGGSINFNFNTRQSHSVLHKHLRTSRGTHRRNDGYFLRGESFFNVATEIERLDTDDPDDPYSLRKPKIIDSYGGVSLHEQSHGESFWALFMKRFRGNGFYILDEPESALSPVRQMAMLQQIHRLVDDDSQFIIATHSPILLAYPFATIYQLTQNGVQKLSYEQTALFKTYSSFFKNPQGVVDDLLGI